MNASVEVLFTPADFEALERRDLSQTVCVVFDVLRATSTMIAALANGAAAILPVGEIAQALALRRRDASALLAGERDGVRIRAHQTGSIDFDLGNSPREFTAQKVSGRTIIMSTTNGTRALGACATARRTLVSSFLNLSVTAQALRRENPAHLALVCSGTLDQAAYEDALGAGALCELLWPELGQGLIADSAHMARQLYRLEEQDLPGAISRSRNGRRLLARPELRDDVAFCAQRDCFQITAQMGKDGAVRKC